MKRNRKAAKKGKSGKAEMFDTVLLMLHAGGGVSAKPRTNAVRARPSALSRASLRRLAKARSRRRGLSVAAPGRAYKRRKAKRRSGEASGKRNSWSGFRG
jgi:hypothetical protein